MNRLRSIIAALATGLILACPLAHAQTSTFGDAITGPLGVISGFNANGGGVDIGENFTAPIAANSAMVTAVFGFVAGDTITAYLYDWDNASGNTVGSALASASITSADSTSFTPFTFNLSAPVVAGSTYAFLFDASTTADIISYEGENFADGALIHGVPGGTGFGNYAGSFDLAFTATLDNVATTPVPEARNLILAGLVLCAGLGVWRHLQAGRRFAFASSDF